LAQEIVEITGISRRAIECDDHHRLANYTVEKRISWTMGRQTKREEDSAYCLLGIVGVHMPLIYGEGKAKAFIRLRKEIENSTSGEIEFFKVLIERYRPVEVRAVVTIEAASY
jgi:hypothetical protein